MTQHTQVTQQAIEALRLASRTSYSEANQDVFEAAIEALQAAQPAPQRLTEAEITLLVEAYYEDFGSAPPDLIRQVESLIFGDAQPAHAHAIDTSPERVEKQAGNVQVPGWLPIESAPKDGTGVLVYCPKSLTVPVTGGYWEDHPECKCWIAGGYMQKVFPPTHWIPLPAAPSTKEGQP